MKTKAKSKFEDMIELSKSRKEMYYFLTVAFTYQTLKEISRMVKDKSILASLPSDTIELFEFPPLGFRNRYRLLDYCSSDTEDVSLGFLYL